MTENQKLREAFRAWIIPLQRAKGYGAALRDEEMVTVNQATGKFYADFELAFEVWQALALQSGADAKDAERYRWLCGFSTVDCPELSWSRRAGLPKEKLDAVLDAAIRARGAV